MPVVQRYGTQKIGLAPIPGVRRSAAETALSEGVGVDLANAEKDRAFGAAIGNPAIAVGVSEFQRIQQEERQQADETALLAAQNQLAAWKSKTLYDPQGGAFTKRGQEALQLPEQVQQSFTETAGKIAATLSTPEQRLAFAKVQSQEWQSVDLQVRRHVYSEMQTYKAGELKGFLANTTDDAIRNANDPVAVSTSLAAAEDAIRKNGPGLGITPAEIDAQVRATRSGVHVGVISQLLATEQTGKAQAYFDAMKGEIEASQFDNIERAVEEGGVRTQGQRKADEIIAAGGSLSQQLDKAKNLDGRLREIVEQRLERNDVLKERQQKEAEEANQRTAFNIVDQTRDVAKIPAAMWTSFNGATRAALYSYAKARAAGVEPETDLPTYYALMQQAAGVPGYGTAKDFVQQNLLNYRGKLDDATFKQLTGLQIALRGADTRAADKDLAGFRTKNEIVDDTLSSYGIDPKAKPGTQEGQAIATLRRMLDVRVDAAQASGQKVTNTEIQGALDDLLSQHVTVPGSWWNIWPGSGPFFSSDKRLVDLGPADVPASERPALEKALRDAGRPVSDATVLNLYQEMLVRRGVKVGR